MLICKLCPVKCGAKRPENAGLCGAAALRASRAAPHYFEEPPVSGKNGSGAIFFSGCPMSCVFCQNHEISAGCAGKDVTVKELAEIMISLQEQGCHNINLVSPTPYVPYIKKALDIAKPSVPVVYNTSGYERVEVLRALEGYVNVYLPDFKYVTPEISGKYSGRPDYPAAAAKALAEMIRQCGGCEYGKNGIMTRGVIVRHLVLPSLKDESIKVLEFLSENYDKDKFLLSLMSQYVPVYRAAEYKEINRKLTSYEYRRVCEEAVKLGFKGFFQSSASQSSDYTPDFDLTGID
ncbi:MAG: radical SAM protein [Clostridia bacterium]|nr:radical SAM protein [Clostridia bacterium]